MSRVFNIGWSQVDITPDEQVPLRGQYYPRLSRGVHSRLGATILAMEGSVDEQAMFICIDAVGCPQEFLNALRDRLGRAISDLDASKVVVNVTHSHNAPSIGGNPDASAKEHAFIERVLGKLTEASVKAWRNKAPAGVARAVDFATIGHCRRAAYSNGTAEMYGETSRQDFIGMEGNEDSTVELMFTFDAGQKATGAIVNIACPSQVMEATYEISSDFMGALREKLKSRFGPEFNTLCQISAAGCQSPRDLVRTTDNEFWSPRGVESLSTRLFDAVIRGYEARGETDYSPCLAHRVEKITLPKRRASYTDYVQALREIEGVDEKRVFADFCAQVEANEMIPNRPGPYDSKLHPFSLLRNAQAVIKRRQEQDESPNFEMELHAVRVGDAIFVTNPFELFLDYGHQIKARSRASQTFVVQLCCGYEGYLPTRRAEKLGNYGALISNGIVGYDGGQKLVDETISAINEVFATE
ncbi:MAG: hypothetical protein GXY38_09575 [Planctomycetes bacterium]|nr:hypothetical protein [Planctomycetota bacterium]